MSRYIDADVLKEQLKSSSVYNDYEWALYADGFIEDMENAPSIDIVRCKECRWWLKNLTEDDEDEAYLHCPVEDGKPDDFCSYGEREGE